MKNFNFIFVEMMIILVIVYFGVNVYLTSIYNNDYTRTYRVEINRLQNEIIRNGIDNIDIDQYSFVTHIAVLEHDVENYNFFEGNGSDYVIRNIDGTYYRFDYQIQLTDEIKAILMSVNIAMVIMIAAILSLLIYVRIKLVNPFHKIKDVPYELSKGNLTVGLKESKNRFFGKFVWGLDLLRDNLEQQKARELSVQKEKKMLVLTISHDIKTPLSAIKLYAKALSRNLYDSEEKRVHIADSIGAKVDEIEGFVSDIIKASSEDFLSLEVQKGEFYLEELMRKINTYYSEKLALLKIDFKMEHYNNCIVKGDIERTVEVLQNIIENAIKYGDGKYITIQISSEEDCRLVTVINSGCTLSENELPHIFDSFWRGSNVRNNSGSGLGLYICRQLLHKMDGDIYAECIGDEMQVTAVLRMM